MSGSSGPAGGSFGGNGGDDPCSSLRLNRPIEGPVPGVADRLNVGSVLDLQLRSNGVDVVVLITKDGQDAGSVIATTRLLHCLREGVRFVATVQRIDDGRIDVEVAAPS